MVVLGLPWSSIARLHLTMSRNKGQRVETVNDQTINQASGMDKTRISFIDSYA